MRSIARFTSLLLAAALTAAQPAYCQPEDGDFLQKLATLDMAGLMDQEISSASRHEQKIREVASAVYVITREQILRSGARHIPEMLRLAPGVQVEQISASDWNVTIRGYDLNVSGKLQVLVDGRSIYSPLFSKVLWDALFIAPEDILRIEVIRGPGAVSWGENAVNGVINIITTASDDFEGSRVIGGGGKEEQGFGSVYTAQKISESTSMKLGGRFQLRDEMDRPDGSGAEDEWQMYGLNFRADSKLDDDNSLVVISDLYSGEAAKRRTLFSSLEPPFFEIDDRDTQLGGGYLLGRWTRQGDAGSEARLQMSYDHAYRSDTVFREDRDTFDIDFQHQFYPVEGHHLIWGTNARWTSDDIRDSFAATAATLSETDFSANLFVLDEIELACLDMAIIPGAKVGYNDYSQVEFHPAIKALKPIGERHSLWGSISRAVRAPSRIDDDVRIDVLSEPAPDGTPVLLALQGSSEFDSEKLLAYELGYRGGVAKGVDFDVAAFYHDYDDLATVEQREPRFENDFRGPHVVVPFVIDNELTGQAYGVETFASWRATSWLDVAGAYSYINLEFTRKAGSTDLGGEGLEGRTPQHQANLRFQFNLPYSMQLDSTTYYVDANTSDFIDSYVRQDLHLGWVASERLSLHLYFQNLLDSKHLEGPNEGSKEVEKAFFAKLVYLFD